MHLYKLWPGKGKYRLSIITFPYLSKEKDYLINLKP